MKPLPHVYRVATQGAAEGPLAVTSEGLPQLSAAAPAEFDGPGDRWSPETLLTASVGACFILTFRAIARASKFSWQNLDCSVEGTLNREGGQLQFTDFVVRARLKTAPGEDAARAERLLEKAASTCLIVNSLKATVRHEAQVQVG